MKKAASISEILAGGFIAVGAIFMIVCGSILVYRAGSISEKLPACLIIALGCFVLRQGIRRTRLALNPSTEQPKFDDGFLRSTEDRLDELKRLKRRDMVTSEEYAAKRQEILKDL